MRCDLLVLGSGIAGLSTALHAAEYGEVLVVTKKDSAESNSNYAQGGIAAVFGADDTFALHREDTLRAGAGLCHPEVVDVLVREGPERVRALLALGARFNLEGDRLSLGREGGHSRRRVVRADDLTGREIERACWTPSRRRRRFGYWRITSPSISRSTRRGAAWEPGCWARSWERRP